MEKNKLIEFLRPNKWKVILVLLMGISLSFIIPYQSFVGGQIKTPSALGIENPYFLLFVLLIIFYTFFSLLECIFKKKKDDK